MLVYVCSTLCEMVDIRRQVLNLMELLNSLVFFFCLHANLFAILIVNQLPSGMGVVSSSPRLPTISASLRLIPLLNPMKASAAKRVVVKKGLIAESLSLQSIITTHNYNFTRFKTVLLLPLRWVFGYLCPPRAIGLTCT